MDGEEEQKRSAGIGINDENDDDGNDSGGDKGRTKVEDMSLLSITDGENGRGIPVVKFIDDVEEFANSFQPMASAELIIGAYSELHQKFKTFETTLTQKSTFKHVHVRFWIHETHISLHVGFNSLVCLTCFGFIF